MLLELKNLENVEIEKKLSIESEEKVNINNRYQLERKEKIATKKELLKEKLNKRNDLILQKLPLDNIISGKINFLKILVAISAILYYLGFCYFTFFKSTDIMDKYSVIIGLTPPLLLFLYTLIIEKTFNFTTIIVNKKVNIQKDIYNKFNFRFMYKCFFTCSV